MVKTSVWPVTWKADLNSSVLHFLQQPENQKKQTDREKGCTLFKCSHMPRQRCSANQHSARRHWGMQNLHSLPPNILLKISSVWCDAYKRLSSHVLEPAMENQIWRSIPNVLLQLKILWLECIAVFIYTLSRNILRAVDSATTYGLLKPKTIFF